MMKTITANVKVEIRVDPTDEDAIRESVKEALEEAIEDDSFQYEIEESEDEDF